MGAARPPRQHPPRRHPPLGSRTAAPLRTRDGAATDVPAASRPPGTSSRCCRPWPASPARCRRRCSPATSACRARRPTTCSASSGRRLRRAPARGAAVRARASRRSSSARRTCARTTRPAGASGARAARRRVGHTAHLAVLHGREVLYVVEERAPGRPPLVTDVGVRLPAQLTASGRAILAAAAGGPGAGALPRCRVRSSTARRGPASLSALRRLLSTSAARARTEDGEVTPGFASWPRRSRPHRPPGRRGRGDLPVRGRAAGRPWALLRLRPRGGGVQPPSGRAPAPLGC